MRSFQYLGHDVTDQDKDVTVFKVIFDKETFAMSLTLSKDEKTGQYMLGTFRFHTSSDEINKMMAAAK